MEWLKPVASDASLHCGNNGAVTISDLRQEECWLLMAPG